MNCKDPNPQSVSDSCSMHDRPVSYCAVDLAKELRQANLQKSELEAKLAHCEANLSVERHQAKSMDLELQDSKRLKSVLEAEVMQKDLCIADLRSKDRVRVADLLKDLEDYSREEITLSRLGEILNQSPSVLRAVFVRAGKRMSNEDQAAEKQVEEMRKLLQKCRFRGLPFEVDREITSLLSGSEKRIDLGCICKDGNGFAENGCPCPVHKDI